MPTSALVLVLVAAVAHATWNFLAKRAAESQHLIWFSSLGETVLFFPLVLWIGIQSHRSLGARAVVFLLATGILHVFYFECLQRGYRAGDLSVVYPLARGTGPLLAFAGALVVLHEHASRWATVGAVLVSLGILLLSGATTARQNRTARAGIMWGALTGCMIAAYTLVDGYSIKTLLLSPVLVDYAENLFRTVAFSGRACRDRIGIVNEYRKYWRESLAISVLTPIGYILVLFAMKRAPISRVAPVREMSMIIGAYLGTKFLKEGYGVRRLVGATLIAGGVAALTAG